MIGWGIYLIKHVSQVVIWVNPGSNSITEENKILDRGVEKESLNISFISLWFLQL